MKRTIAFLAVAVLVIGGGAAAFAATGDRKGPVDPAKRAEARACVEKARADHPDDKAATRAAAKECLTAAGIDRPRHGHLRKAVREEVEKLAPEQRAALKDCMEAARADHTDDKAGRREAVKACLSQAGINPPTPPTPAP